MAQHAVEKVIAKIYGGGRGAVFTPKDFMGLANPEQERD